MIDPADLFGQKRETDSDSVEQETSISPAIFDESTRADQIELRERLKLLHVSIEDDLFEEKDRNMLRSWLQVADAFVADGAIEEAEAAIGQVSKTVGKRVLRAHRQNSVRQQR